MALVPTLGASTKTFVANDLPRREELYLEGANYSRLAAEREAVLHSMEVKQANLFNMERLEEQARRLRRAQLERELFDREERLHERFNEDRLRALSLKDSNLRLREQMAREEERRLRARKSHAELQWAQERDRRRREEEVYKHRVRSFGASQPYLPLPRSRHNSGMLMPYRAPTATPHHLLPPSQGLTPFPGSHRHGSGYVSPHYSRPGLPPRPPVYRRASRSLGAFDQRPPRAVLTPTAPFSHPAPVPRLTPRGRRLSEPDLMRAMVRQPSYRL